jgi:hypothetical protein
MLGNPEFPFQLAKRYHVTDRARTLEAVSKRFPSAPYEVLTVRANP